MAIKLMAIRRWQGTEKMKFYALLSLNVKGIDESKRQLFYEELKKDKWKKQEGPNTPNTVWIRGYKAFDEDRARAKATKSVEQAAEASKVKRVPAIIALGMTEPEPIWVGLQVG